nr:ComEC/Rec2 family competence protein [Terrimicrobiaceae bacterium]
MNPQANKTAPFWRQRLPFLGLLALAVTGILAAHVLPVPSVFWLGAAAAALLAYAATRHGAAMAAMTICVFAAVHLWQGRESPAAEFSRQAGRPPALASVRGIVASEPRVFAREGSGFELSVKEMTLDGRTIRPGFLIQVLWPGSPPSVGDEIVGTGSLERIPQPRNPGQFDFARWSATRGIYLQLRVADRRDGQILAQDRANPITAAALRARNWMRSTLERGVGDPVVSGLIVAMVAGDTSAMPEQIQEEFRNTGTYHLFSVSGLHVGMLTLILWHVFRTLRVPRQYASLAIIPLVFFYVVMTGWKPASVRAAIMASIVLCGFLTSRHPILANNLFAAAFLILLANTNELFNPGFQLSFTVVAAILLFAGPFTAWLRRPFQPDPFLPEKLLRPSQRLLLQGGRQTASLAGVSAAAWLGSFPLTVGYFHLVSFTALPAN